MRRVWCQGGGRAAARVARGQNPAAVRGVRGSLLCVSGTGFSSNAYHEFGYMLEI